MFEDEGYGTPTDLRSPVARVEGEPRVPVLTLNDLGDLFVPFAMEQAYAAEVADNGRADLLVQRAIRATGHCEFSAVEAETAWDDLVTWVQEGTRLDGDDVLGPTPWPTRPTAPLLRPRGARGRGAPVRGGHVATVRAVH